MSFKSQQGVALVAVLVVTTVLLVLTAALDKAINSRASLALEAKQQSEQFLAAKAKLNELTYYIATQRITAAGVSRGINLPGPKEDGIWTLPIVGDEIRQDGLKYGDCHQLCYSVQNMKGLIPINSGSQLWLNQWLKSQPLTMSQSSRVKDIIADYADADEWRRPAGAEKAEYEGSLPPTNYLYQQCSQLHNLIPAEKTVIKQLSEWCSLARSGTVNLNAMPVNLWRQLWPGSAEKVADARTRGNWPVSMEQLIALEPALNNMASERYSPLGDSGFIVSVKAGPYEEQWLIKRSKQLLPPVKRILYTQ